MSKQSVTDAVQSICAAIEGVRSVQLGYPEPGAVIHDSLPLVALKVGRARWQQITGGPSGEVQVDYTVKLRLYIANFDAEDVDVETEALPFDDLFRAAFYTDRTLGGACFFSTLTVAADNLDEAYKLAEETGYIDYLLAVEEHVAANAAAG